MKLVNVAAGMVLLLGVSHSVMAAVGGGTHWGYEGHDGPEHWGELSKNYATCQTGKHQSPVNIIGAKAAHLSKIEFHYRDSALDVVNNGHSIQVNVAPGSYIEVAGKKYDLLQFHFHSPSEHEVNGKHADMVAHLVHKAKDGQLGVIGVLMSKGESNSEIARIWDYLPRHKGQHTKGLAKVNAANLLPKNTAYYSYSGSLTTPPCSEGVNWMVLQNPVNVSPEQVIEFTHLFNKSIRPVQPLHARMIKAN